MFRLHHLRFEIVVPDSWAYVYEPKAPGMHGDIAFRHEKKDSFVIIPAPFEYAENAASSQAKAYAEHSMTWSVGQADNEPILQERKRANSSMYYFDVLKKDISSLMTQGYAAVEHFVLTFVIYRQRDDRSALGKGLAAIETANLVDLRRHYSVKGLMKRLDRLRQKHELRQ